MNMKHNTPPLRLSPRYWAREEGWGMAVNGYCYRYRAESTEDVESVLALARENEQCVGMRGGGNSYGDAALNSQHILLDTSRMNQIMSWNPETGEVETGPGVTIEQLWRRIVGDGWWLPVVSGTMKTTMGGCAAMNIHGKNNFKMGTFGEHITEFDLMTPDGRVLTCSPAQNPDLYYAAISGFGMLGVFTRFKLQMKKIHSGLMRVEAFNTRTVAEMIDAIEARHERADYLVGWIDGTACGRGCGRGIVHQSNYLKPGEDPDPKSTMSVAAQDLPSRIMGVFPKSMMYLFLGPFVNNLGMHAINTAKYVSGRIMPQGHTYLQSHAAFAFLLDYVPNWKYSYRPGGLIQYQSFIPKARAAETFETLLRMSKESGLPTYLSVLKKHKPDPFLLTHALDGYSLAMDYRVTEGNRERIWALAHRMDEVVHDAGGRFYFAKDATLRPESIEKIWPAGALEKLAALKKQYDPNNVFQTDLARRLFAGQFGFGKE